MALRLLDSETGFALPVRSVQTNLIQVAGGGNREGEMQIILQERSAQLKLSAPGYQDFVATVEPVNPETAVEPNLRPLVQPKEFETRALQQFVSPRGTAVVGFLSDDITGKPFASVQEATQLVLRTCRDGS